MVKLKREMSEWQMQIQEKSKIAAREQELRKEVSAKLSKVEQELTRRSEEHAMLRSNLEKTIESVQTEMQTGQTTNVQLASENKMLKGQVELVKRATSSTLEDIKRLASEKGTAVTKQKELRTELDKTHTASAASSKKVTELESEIRNLKEQLMVLQTVKVDLDAECATRQVLEQESAMMKEASERAVHSQGETAELLDAEKEISTALRESAAKTEEELKKVSEKACFLESSLKDLRLSKLDADAKHVALSKELDQLSADIKKVQDTLAAKEAAYDTSHGQQAEKLSKTESQVELLQQELADSEAQRKLDKRKGDKRIQDVTKQLQKMDKRESNDSRTMAQPPRSSNSSAEFPSPSSRGNVSSASAGSKLSRASSASRSPNSSTAGCRLCAKTEDRLRFFESHTAELTNDLKNQRKIINSFLLREQHGKLAPAPRAIQSHRPKSALETMTSAFSSNKSGKMTLDLALEMNDKLQQVTEDTILKNIHLQESLDIITSQIAKR